MLKKNVVIAVPQYTGPHTPGELFNITKRYFERTGKRQVAMCEKNDHIHSLIVGEHGAVKLTTEMPPKYKRAQTSAIAFLATLRRSIAVFGEDSFDIRHNVGQYSKYLTMSVIEEEYAARANAMQVAQIRVLMDLHNITAFDYSSQTAKVRDMMTIDSAEVGFSRYLKNHQV